MPFLAQMEERLICNQRAVGSNPANGTMRRAARIPPKTGH